MMSFREIERNIHDLTQVPAFDEAVPSQLQRLSYELLDAYQLPSPKDADDSHFLKLFSVLGETFEHFDRSSEARNVVSRGEEYFSRLPAEIAPGLDISRRKMIREEIRYVLSFAYSAHFRLGQLNDAETKFDKCIRLIEGGLRTADFPCSETLAQALRFRGYVYTRFGRNDDATKDLRRALELYAEKAERSLRDKRAVGPATGLYWLRHRSVRVLLDLGSIYHFQGMLARALSAASAARLAQVHGDKEAFVDRLTRAFVTLLRVQVKRAMVGRSSPELAVMVRDIQEAYRTFQLFEHRGGALKAKYELGLTYLYCVDDHENARRCLEEVVAEGNSRGEYRWVCYAWARLGHLLTPEADRAKELTSKALELASQNRLQLCQVDALLARAEVNLRAAGGSSDARADLRHAMEFAAVRNGENPRLQYRCELLLARSYIAESRREEGDDWLRRAARLKPRVEHQSLRDLAAAIQAEADAVGSDFRIPAGDDYQYWSHELRLREWLIKGARRQFRTDRAVAKNLGITRTTLASWESHHPSKAHRKVGRSRGR
jgi:tetratricopeptide (TPR) repeat protein